MNKDPLNNHHSGDGRPPTDDDDEDYNENHEDDRKKLPIDGEDENLEDNLYFDNSSTNPPSTSTSSIDKIDAIIPTDDEDSQFNFYFLIIYFWVVVEWDDSCGKIWWDSNVFR